MTTLLAFLGFILLYIIGEAIVGFIFSKLPEKSEEVFFKLIVIALIIICSAFIFIALFFVLPKVI